MKKYIITTLLLAIVATSAFAVTDSFSVTTTVGEIGVMKVTQAAITETTLTFFNGMADFTSLPISSAGNQTFSAYVTTLSNKRTGYNVKLSASAMKSTEGTTTSYINFTVGSNNATVTTNGAATIAATTPVVVVPNLTAVTAASYPITLSVDETSYNAAVSGSYVGSVTFTFTAT